MLDQVRGILGEKKIQVGQIASSDGFRVAQHSIDVEEHTMTSLDPRRHGLAQGSCSWEPLLRRQNQPIRDDQFNSLIPVLGKFCRMVVLWSIVSSRGSSV